MMLLTNGCVMCQVGDTPDWWKLTPDQTGSYVKGSWSPLANGPNSPLYYASAVLKDGRVFVAGGEYNAGAQVDLLAAEIYDPVANTWTSIGTPPGWIHLGDAPSCVLTDGRVIVGSIENNRTAIYNPATNTWAAGGNKLNASSSEETWTLLRDGTVLTCNCNGHPGTEKYIPSSNTWVTAGPTPVDLVEASSIEIGPALLLTDGRVFAVGATGHTALYTPPTVPTQPGVWHAGPSFPVLGGQQLIAKDAPGCLMPNGHVLCAASPAAGCALSFGGYCPPTHFYEFDPVANTLVTAPNPTNSGDAVYHGCLLLLPTGQVLFSNDSNVISVYQPSGGPNPAWHPHVTTAPHTVQHGHTYPLSGRQFNGLSEANSYGDDRRMATNYPLVTIRHNASGHVVYCRTHGHSTMGVATGGAIVSTNFDVPAAITLGPSTLTVIANGIASPGVAITVT
jgi:hypothetical protein